MQQLLQLQSLHMKPVDTIYTPKFNTSYLKNRNCQVLNFRLSVKIVMCGSSILNCWPGNPGAIRAARVEDLRPRKKMFKNSNLVL